MNNFQSANHVINQLTNVKPTKTKNTMKTTKINMEQLIKYNEFINAFISYYSVFYTSDQYNELVKTVYSINPLDPMQGTINRYNYCLEISNFDKTTERVNQLTN